MKITLFKNKKGLIHGTDPRRISCDRAGILHVGKTQIEVTSDGNAVMPMLFYGATGEFAASFADENGETYDLGNAVVHAGWIRPPSPEAVELMELRVRADEAEDRLEMLEGLFDTNALNFII